MPITRRLREPLASLGYRPHSEFPPLLTVLGAFHDAPRASAIRSRSLQKVFSSARGVSYSIDYRAAHLCRLCRLTGLLAALAHDEHPLGQDRFPHPPREEKTASTTRDGFHRTMPKDPRHAHPFECERPSSASTVPRFCHRGPSSDASLPGAVSRFGLAPVHSRRHRRCRRCGVNFFEP